MCALSKGVMKLCQCEASVGIVCIWMCSGSLLKQSLESLTQVRTLCPERHNVPHSENIQDGTERASVSVPLPSFHVDALTEALMIRKASERPIHTLAHLCQEYCVKDKLHQVRIEQDCLRNAPSCNCLVPTMLC